jgi:SPP1 gp7 family putative phage head morphogenesis protein
VLAAVRPNAGIEAAYRRKIDALVTEMHESVLYWLTAAYRANAPEMAADASPAETLRRIFARLTKRWQRKFDDMAPKLAEYFATAATKRADGALAAILKEGGMTVEFKMTAAVNDVFRATLAENVNLIKSIPEQYLTQVQTSVMQSVQLGRDLGALRKDIEARYGLTRKRAALISRDQNNKATAVITRARQTELGITQALWMHSSAGKHPRPSHVAANGKPYDVAKGMFLDGVWTFPGHEINCRCVSRSIVPGFS